MVKPVMVSGIMEDFDFSRFAGIGGRALGDEVQILRKQSGFVSLADSQLKLTRNWSTLSSVGTSVLLLSHVYMVSPPHGHSLQGVQMTVRWVYFLKEGTKITGNN